MFTPLCVAIFWVRLFISSEKVKGVSELKDYRASSIGIPLIESEYMKAEKEKHLASFFRHL